tara:strand:- start:24422 stop:25549 length:1128 start_codon:yes stop_codon:yes gene_type:complete
MQTYVVNLNSEISKSFRCNKAADSLDIDVNKKSNHYFKVNADLETEYNIGLIVGASGSGKTTLAKQILGDECFKEYIDLSKPVIDQLPKELDYNSCQKILSGVGLTSVPCWIRPSYTLSNGQKARAEMALACYNSKDDVIAIDEFTSVVDRTVAKVMSHSIQKFARREKKTIILLACHYDIIEWLNPDWIIDCNKQSYTDRRALRLDFKRKEQLEFTIKEIDKSSWKYFSKYHYLSDKLPGGKLYTYGLFEGDNQIGFICYANYTPKRKNKDWIFHMNRVVVHPDYAGLGLGIHLINETSEHVSKKPEMRVMSKFSSLPVFKAMTKNRQWKLKKISRDVVTKKFGVGLKQTNKDSFRTKVKTYSFEYMPKWKNGG